MPAATDNVPASPPPAGVDNIHDPAGDDIWGDAPAATETPSSSTSSDYDFDDPAQAELAPAATNGKPTSASGPDDDTAEIPADTDEGGQPKPAATRESKALRPDQLLRASRLNFTPQQLQKFSDPEVLDAVLEREEAILAAAQASAQQQQELAQRQNPYAQLWQAAQAANLKPKIDKAQLVEQGFDEAQIDFVQQQLDAMANSMSGVVSPLVLQLARIAEAQRAHQLATERAEQERAVAEWNRDLDRMVGNLDEHMQKIVKRGDNMQKLRMKCGILAQAHAQAGEQISNQELFDEAMAVTFSKQMESVVRENVREDVQRRNGRGIARAIPGGQRLAGTPEQRAAQFATRYRQRKWGLPN